MWFLFFFILLFCLLLWLPIEVEIDTTQQTYRARWKGILALWCVPDEAGFHWFFQIFFWKMEWKSSAEASKRVKKTVKKEKAGSKSWIRFSRHKIRPLFRAVSKAIHVKRFRIDWDTGDYIYNAWLYPAFRKMSRGRRQLTINFFGKQELAIILQTRLGLLLLAGLRTFFILKQ